MSPVANGFLPNSEKDLIVKNSYKVAVGVVAAMSLGLAAAAFAHPGFMGGGMGYGMMGGGMGPGMMMRGGGGMGPGMMGGMGPRAMGPGFAGPAAGPQLMTPEERTALWEKMRSAKTPEERQKLAQANHAEMEKRAKEKGITLPQGYGPRGGYGRNPTPPEAGNR